MATTTMNISLPDSMRHFIDKRLEDDGYGSASEYVRDLIRADQKLQEQQKLESLLLKRLDSDKVSKFDIADVKKELSKRLASRKK